MIKYFCDKCGTELPLNIKQRVRVTVNDKTEHEMELCQACVAHMHWFLGERSYAGIRKTIIDRRPS